MDKIKYMTIADAYLISIIIRITLHQNCFL